MAMTGLRAAVIAIIGLGVAAPAYADGQVENARKLWHDSLVDVFNETVQLIDAENTDEAKETIGKLHDLSKQMQDAVQNIQKNASALASSLGDAWSDTQRQMDAFNTTVGAVEQNIGHQRVGTDTLKSAFSSADAALEKSTAYTEDFGKKFAAICDSCR
jgi:hypothetical protein